MVTISKQKTTKKIIKKEPASRKDLIRSRMVSIDDLELPRINMCIYGRSATGKTRLMSTFTKQGKLLHIVCADNHLNEARSIKGMKGITVVPLMHPDELSDLISIAVEDKYTTIGFDHITEFCDMVLAKVMGLEKIPEQKSWGMATQSDYAAMGLEVKTYIRELFDWNGNVIINGHERMYNTKEETDIASPFISIAATPAVAGWISGNCDYVAQTFIRSKMKVVQKKIGTKVVTRQEATDQKEFCLRVGPHDSYFTKFRVPYGVELPDVIVEPTYDKIKHLLGIT